MKTEKDKTEQTDTEQTETEQSEPTAQTEDNNESSDPAHYLLNYNSHFPNKTPILFPFQRCVNKKKYWKVREMDPFSLKENPF